MLNIIVRGMLPVFALIAILSGLAASWPTADSLSDDLTRLVADPDADCAAPCFMGIQPGKTPFELAVMRLESHPWAQTIRTGGQEFFDQYATWAWTGSQPAIINGALRGGLVSNYGVVMEIVITTDASFGQLVAAFGLPQTTRSCDAYSVDVVCHQAVYEAAYTVVDLAYPCPMTLFQLMGQSARLRFFDPSLQPEDVFTYSDYRLPVSTCP